MIETQIRTTEIQSVTSGSTYTVNRSLNHVMVVVDPASVLASLALTMPLNPFDTQEVSFHFGGTVAGNAAVVTALTIAANTGQALMEPAAPTTANGGQCFRYKYRLSNTKWYRLV